MSAINENKTELSPKTPGPVTTGIKRNQPDSPYALSPNLRQTEPRLKAWQDDTAFSDTSVIEPNPVSKWLDLIPPQFKYQTLSSLF